jgi:hypothetical protein
MMVWPDRSGGGPADAHIGQLHSLSNPYLAKTPCGIARTRFPATIRLHAGTPKFAHGLSNLDKFRRFSLSNHSQLV